MNPAAQKCSESSYSMSDDCGKAVQVQPLNFDGYLVKDIYTTVN